MAVRTERAEVGWVVVFLVAVDVIDIELAAVLCNESADLAGIFFMDGVGTLAAATALGAPVLSAPTSLNGMNPTDLASRSLGFSHK